MNVLKQKCPHFNYYQPIVLIDMTLDIAIVTLEMTRTF
jgi:hypothetical protein